MVIRIPWMLRYLDARYVSIVGHQGLTCFVDDFPRFHRAIEGYTQRDHQRELIDGTMTIVPGINFLPWDIFGFCMPFSGPHGNYEGAAHRVEFADARQAFYTGYIKDHGLKVETVFLPNGISTLFGPVLARRNDVGVLRMSNLNEFLVAIQRGHYVTTAGEDIFYSAFGDSALNLGMQCMQCYYREFMAGVELDAARSKSNAAMRSARIVIEKNYAMVSIFFPSFDQLREIKSQKSFRHP